MIVPLLFVAASEGVLALLEQEADVRVDKPGLARLSLPQEVIAATRPDLSDVRLYAGDREVVYIVDSGDVVATHVESSALRVLGAKREEKPQSDAPTLFVETYELQAPTMAGLFELVIDSSRPRFVHRVSVSQDGVNTLDRASIFRLPQMGANKNALPIRVQAGKRLRVVIEGESTGFLEPRFSLVRSAHLGATKDLEIPFEEAKLTRRDTHTLVALERPGGVVPSALLLTSSSEIFDRQVQVYDESRVYGERAIGSARVFRVGGAFPVEELLIPTGAARGERLRVEIDDGDSPPLSAIALRGVVRQPSLVFSAPEQTLTLRFGGGRAKRPRYDVSSLIPRAGESVAAARAEAVERLFGVLQVASLSSPRKNPSFNPAPALAFAMRPGAPCDVKKFTHRRAVTIGASREGLLRLTLGPEDRAVLRDDLGDVRLVDQSGKQWPYLLEGQASEVWRPLDVSAGETRDQRTRFRLSDEVAPVRIDQIVLSVAQAFVDRAYRLFAVGDAEAETLLSAGRLQKSADGQEPLLLRFPSARVHALVLEVQDGDDAPLEITGASGQLWNASLFAVAAPGSYMLFMGAQAEEAPRYDLERARDVVLSVRSDDVSAEPLVANPDYLPNATSKDRARQMELALWVVILLAVLVLGGLTFRLAKAA